MKKVVQWILVLVIVCFGAFNMIDTVSAIVPEAPMKDLIVSTDGVLTKNAVVTLLNVEYGMRVTEADIDSMKQELLKLPQVAHVELSKSAFGNVTVELLEKQPIASVFNKEWGYLLENGSYVSAENYGLGVLPIVSQKQHARILLKILKKIKHADVAMYESISELKWDDTMNAAVLFIKEGALRVFVGRDSDFEKLAHKYRSLESNGMCASLKEKIIDMRFADFAYLR